MAWPAATAVHAVRVYFAAGSALQTAYPPLAAAALGTDQLAGERALLDF